ncbi:DNA-3-methyladenine glycosylase 2 family protein [Roseomonas sp. SSH11]|uniref:DNA-3-methyladenine glycosylase II n=1 Tax=Pararoseomonas baculiformis TaxID=2820812 RepID=A0ABS4AGU3_9PROT|nr:DNA-3-methyladenine glycosylase 2 family protein [Pararoseomonas baculiformis]MBP0446221.1 DNA-3-methyladenine glycosylase 2 family protein [Pararoseomonas baculiformis]
MSRPPPPSTTFPMHPPPEWAERGLAALAGLDPALHCVLARCGPLPWRRRPRGFPGLLRTICGQQISNRAAGAIWARLSAIPGALEPATLLLLDDATLCGAAGLSRPKAAHARSLATAILEGRLRLEALPDMPDEEAVAHLCTIRGLGRWTAQVHLLFAEDRPDIFPEGDIALAASLAHLRELPARPAPKALTALAAEWRPYRSLAARLLWHNWRHATGRPGADPEDDG